MGRRGRTIDLVGRAFPQYFSPLLPVVPLHKIWRLSFSIVVAFQYTFCSPGDLSLCDAPNCARSANGLHPKPQVKGNRLPLTLNITKALKEVRLLDSIAQWEWYGFTNDSSKWFASVRSTLADNSP